MLSELELRFSGNDLEILCALGNICKFYNIDSETLEAEQKMYASFRRVRGLGHMTVSEMLLGQCRRMIYSIYFQSLLR